MIQLTETLFLSADKYQFIIKEEKISKDGKKQLKNISFLPKLDMVFNYIFELNLKKELILTPSELTYHKALKEVAEDMQEELTNKLIEISADVKKWLSCMDKEAKD